MGINIGLKYAERMHYREVRSKIINVFILILNSAGPGEGGAEPEEELRLQLSQH